MKSYELVIFDCDGVLVDSETITNAVIISMLKPYGIVLNRSGYIQRYVGMTLEACTRKINDEFNVVLPDDFISIYHQRSLKALELNLVEIDGVRSLIEGLKIPFCVASNSHETKVKMMLEKTGLIKYFTGKIYSASQVANPKPAPDVYLMAATKNGIAPENCLVIEDTPTGVTAGKAAGMIVLGYVGLFDAEILIKAGADQTFSHMDQIRL